MRDDLACVVTAQAARALCMVLRGRGVLRYGIIKGKVMVPWDLHWPIGRLQGDLSASPQRPELGAMSGGPLAALLSIACIGWLHCSAQVNTGTRLQGHARDAAGHPLG